MLAGVMVYHYVPCLCVRPVAAYPHLHRGTVPDIAEAKLGWSPEIVPHAPVLPWTCHLFNEILCNGRPAFQRIIDRELPATHEGIKKPTLLGVENHLSPTVPTPAADVPRFWGMSSNHNDVYTAQSKYTRPL